jgi:predicted ester cyclase
MLYMTGAMDRQEAAMATDANKAVVRRFNAAVIERGDRAAFEALIAADFVNRSALAGAPNGPESMWTTFATVLRPALADLTVTIHDQIAEGDKVTTRKTITGTHVSALMGVAATGRAVAIDVIDIVRIAEGRYAEHWGLNTLAAVLAQLSR